MSRAASGRVVCVGGAVVDRLFHLVAPAVPRTSNPARVSGSYGGVARNVAENLARLGVPVSLVSCVGEDGAGLGLLAHAQAAGIDTTGVRTVPGAHTAEYVAVIEPDGELALGVASMAVLAQVAAEDLAAVLSARTAPWVLVDCNLEAEVLAGCLRVARAAGARVAVDAVSTAKVTRLPADLSGVDVLFCNLDEGHALAAARGHAVAAGQDTEVAAVGLALGAAAVVLTRGPHPALVVTPEGAAAMNVVGEPDVVDVTGAGDAFLAGTLAGLVEGRPLLDACAAGTRIALLTVASEHSVRPDLSPEDLKP